MSGTSNAMQSAMGQLPPNLQNYVGGPSYAGYQRVPSAGIAQPKFGGNFFSQAQQQYEQTLPGAGVRPTIGGPQPFYRPAANVNYGGMGPYNTLTQDMANQQLGQYQFGPRQPFQYQPASRGYLQFPQQMLGGLKPFMQRPNPYASTGQYLTGWGDRFSQAMPLGALNTVFSNFYRPFR